MRASLPMIVFHRACICIHASIGAVSEAWLLLLLLLVVVVVLMFVLLLPTA
jgi:hypothetical protein